MRERAVVHHAPVHPATSHTRRPAIIRSPALLVLLAALLVPAPAGAWHAAPADQAMTVGPALTAAELRPPIVKKFIPFSRKRKQQMAAYSKRHYGDWTWTLSDPKVIVEHFTTSHQLMDAWWYFAGNTMARGELPGVCSHFLIDTDGTIVQVMPLTIRCRHATGLNNLAIGIEDVGVSDLEIMRNPRMMEASLRLTLWLMARYGIPVRDVIGHNEIIFSPWHHDLVAAFQCMRHSDWSRPHMRQYRELLKERARAAEVPVGDPPAWVTPDC